MAGRRTAGGRAGGRTGGGRAGGRPPGGHADEPTPGSAADATPDADPESVARAIVLRRLTAAPRTRAQLADDLRRRDVPDEVADQVLDRFGEVGLVDDEAFAEAWVRTRHTGRGLARRALAHELRARGVDDETVAQAVGAVGPDEEAAAARSLVAKRLASTRGLPTDRRVRRLAGMLARKGYPSGLAMRVVRDALAAERGSDAPTGEGPEGLGWEPAEG